MRTSFIKKEDGLEGVIQCKVGNRGRISFNFDVGSLLYWYPLNFNYEYRHTHVQGNLYLTKADVHGRKIDYGIHTKTNMANRKDKRFNPEEDIWYIPEVSENNINISLLARGHGITSFLDYAEGKKVSIININSGIEKVHDLIDEIKKDVKSSFIADYEIKYERLMDLRGDIELIDVEYYKYLTEEQEEDLLDYGKMLMMLIEMKKVSEAEREEELEEVN